MPNQENVVEFISFREAVEENSLGSVDSMNIPMETESMLGLDTNDVEMQDLERAIIAQEFRMEDIENSHWLELQRRDATINDLVELNRRLDQNLVEVRARVSQARNVLEE